MTADNIVADIDSQTRATSKAEVGWANAGFSSVNGTCYDKHRPSKKDGLCTSIMNKKLNKDKGKTLHMLSQKLSAGLQQKVDSNIPMTLR